MIFRIFIGLVALLCVYTGYNTVQIMLVKHAVYKAEDAYVLGAKDGDLRLVEFLDYGCSNCQSLHPILMRSLERDGNVRYIIRPIHAGPGENGTQAGRLVYAAGRQGKFAEAHTALIENYRPIDEAFIANFAQVLELDATQLRRDLEDPEIDALLIANLENLKKLKGKVVPALLMNGKVLLQVSDEIPDSDRLISLFNQARAL